MRPASRFQTKKQVLGPVLVPESASGRPRTVLGEKAKRLREGAHTQREGNRDSGRGDRDTERGGKDPERRTRTPGGDTKTGGGQRIRSWRTETLRGRSSPVGEWNMLRQNQPGHRSRRR